MLRLAPVPASIIIALVAASPKCMADVEEVFGPSRARLVCAQTPEVRDPRDKAAYLAQCSVELADKNNFTGRFTVHVPGASQLPFARRAGRFLALLWGMANRRYGTECARLRD